MCSKREKKVQTKHAVSMLLTLLLISSITALNIAFLVPRTFAPLGPSPAMWVTPPLNVYEKNSLFTVTIYLNDTKNQYGYNVGGWALTLGYDPSVLSISSVTEGPYLKSSGATTYFSSSSGPSGESMSCLITSYAWANGPGDLVYIQFNVVGNGKVNLVLSGAQLLGPNPDYTPIPNLSTHDGLFYTTYPKAYFYYLPSTTAPTLPWIPDYIRRDPVLGDNIVFNASAFTLGITYLGSYDPNGGTITNYRWNFGDGNVTSGASYSVITHSYASEGSYHTVLNVTDDEGKTDSYDRSVSVLKRDVAVTGIEVSPTLASPGEDISIKVTIKNLGTKSGIEYVNVTLFYNTTLIWYNTTRTPKLSAWSNVFEIDPVSRVAPMQFLQGQSITINYTWTTSGVSLGNYTISANISLVDQSAQNFLKDLYLKELDFNITNNEKTWNGIVTLSTLHNLAVTDITLSPALKSPSVISYGATAITIDVTVKNTGDFDEIFYLTLYQNSTLLMNWTSVTLAAKSMIIEEYIWNPSSLPIGHYSIVATASNVTGEVQNGRTGDNKLLLPIIITSRPTAIFSYSPSKPTILDTIQFDASGSQAAPGWSITQYSWRVNGTADNIMNTFGAKPQKPFSQRATYNISLTVTDSAGVTNTTFLIIHVGITPLSNFAFTPSTPKADQTVTFDASQSAADSVSAPGTDVLTSYSWNFSDGTTFILVGQNLTKSTTHSFTKSGNFTVTLTVFDGEGLNATIQKFVLVSKITSAVSLTLSVQTIKVSQNVTITGQVTPPRLGAKVTILYKQGSGAWTFLQNVTSDQSGNYNYVWIINTAGNYTVKTQIWGDDKYTNAESQPSTIQVQAAIVQPPPGLIDLTPYFVAGVIIIIVIGVAYYLMKRRK